MENNFNLRKFLVENKLTQNSRQQSEGAADNLELKNVAKQLYLGLKKMGADVELATNSAVINQAKKGDRDEKNVWIYQGDDVIEITLVGDKAISFEDKIKNDPAFTKFKFPETGFEDGETWGGQKTRSIQITPGATTSENKPTGNSKLLNENPNDIIWTDEEEDTGSHGTFNQLDLDASELDYYEVTLLGYSPSTGKAYFGTTSGEYGEVNYEDVEGVEEMNPRLTKNYVEDLKKYRPEHYKKFMSIAGGMEEGDYKKEGEMEEGEKKMTKREKALQEIVKKALMNESNYDSEAAAKVEKQIGSIVDIFSKSGDQEKKELDQAIEKAEKETGTEIPAYDKEILHQRLASRRRFDIAQEQ